MHFGGSNGFIDRKKLKAVFKVLIYVGSFLGYAVSSVGLWICS